MQLTFQHTLMECVIDKIHETDRQINMESALWSIHAFDFFFVSWKNDNNKLNRQPSHGPLCRVCVAFKDYWFVSQHKACCFTCTTWFVDVLLYFTDIERICLRIINFFFTFYYQTLTKDKLLIVVTNKSVLWNSVFPIICPRCDWLMSSLSFSNL